MPSVSTILSAGLLAYLATAKPMPQQLDFGQISAAPSVASGPQLNGLANQTATLYTTFAVGPTAAPSAPQGSKRAVRRDYQYNPTYNANFGKTYFDTSVNAGTLTWLSGGSTHNFYGNVNNKGSIVISQTSYLKQNPFAGGQTCDWSGSNSANGNLKNYFGASIQLNDIGSYSAPTYDWDIETMVNNGTIQWCGRGDTGGSTYHLFVDQDSVNNGLISYEQAFDNQGGAFFWRNQVLTTAGKGSNCYNNGAFRLINVVFHNVQNIYGSGCWQLGKGSVLYLEDGTGVFQNPTQGPSLPGQSISFQDSSAVLHMDTAVYSKNSNFGAQLYGFGNGNAIEFYESIKSFNYDASSGYLTVTMISKNYVKINIGFGYDATKFVNKRNPQKYNYAGYNAIFYLGIAPSSSTPACCGISAPVCSNLGNNPPTQSTSIVAPTSTPASSAASTTTPAAPTTSASPTTTAAATTSAATTTPAGPATTSTTSAVTSPAGPSGASTTTVGTDNGGTPTSASTTACPTTPEEGTYCGFINPEDPCAPQPSGYGPVPTPDTASAFLAFPPLHSSARAAPTSVPAADGTQYSQTFLDLNASSSAQSYIGLHTLTSYSVSDCAALCDGTSLCTAFNIYFERDPSQNPTKNDSTAPTVWGYYCPNPSSTTNIKCTLWGSNLDASTATNQGGYREDFQVVITGSNGYDKTNVTTPADPTGPVTTDIPTATSSIGGTSSSAAGSATSVSQVTTSAAGVTTTSAAGVATSTSAVSQPTGKPGKPGKPWNHPKSCHGKAIDAPKFWMGSKFFPGPFNPQVCSDFALDQNAVNKQSAIGAGKNSYSACQMFNAYYLHKNGSPWGTYCSLYTSALDPGTWATYNGGISGGDTYDCRNSWTFELTIPDPGTC